MLSFNVQVSPNCPEEYVMHIGDIRFLVAEDDEFQRRWMVIMLNNLGVRHVVEVADGISALAALQDEASPIDISIIDLNMPGMDGIELVRHIAKDSNSPSIILVSALDKALLFSVETMSKAYGVDLLGTVEKPASPENLQALIDRYLPRYERKKLQVQVPAFSVAEILAGIEKDEFEPLYQPKVELATGTVKGAEAFSRWRHPEYGMVAPPAYIPVLEQFGEMDALAISVIKHSIKTCLSWHAHGHFIPVSLNISPSSLSGQEFADIVIELVASHRLEPQYVVIEVTESSAVGNMPHFLENLARLRMKGFGISVDDYGTGNSSMQQLLRIPFSELKIDRSFVAGASSNEAMEVVLSASLSICRKLHKQSVAVGVETQEDWEYLRKLGCTYAQGFYIAKPMDGATLPVWMEEWAQFF